MKVSSFIGRIVVIFLMTSVTKYSILDPFATAFSLPPKKEKSAKSQQRQQQQQNRKEVVAPSSRRMFFGYASGVVGGIGSIFQLLPEPANAAIKTGAANPFTGDYDDPNHPGCLRQVKVVGAPMNGVSGSRSAFPLIKITGWDGPDDNPSKSCTTPPPSRDVLWQVEGSVRSSSSALVDFSLRGGPFEPIPVKYESGQMIFPDGNRWKKLPGEQKNRRPKDMSTLSSGPKKRERDDYDY